MNELVHHSIGHQLLVQPHKEAFRCRQKSITYEQFFERASQIANLLQQLGTKPEDRIGIYMGKHLEMPVATYGTLMAGGCYVPIDPGAPLERVAFILKNCGIRTLITHPSKAKDLRKLKDFAKLPLEHVIGTTEIGLELVSEHEWESLRNHSTKIQNPNISSQSLAYIMYTSGSTGAPKGLMHTHASALAYAKHSKELYSVCSDDVLANHAPLHFDISTFEFITGPYAGATTVLVPEEDSLFPAALAQSIEVERYTFWYSVPLALVQMLQSEVLHSIDSSTLRWVLFGGEPLHPKYLVALMRHIPTARFSNVYGPAEVNQCTYYHVPATFSETEKVVPLGHVWSGAKALILDSEDKPSPAREKGELLISSSTMMKGYWAREDLDLEAFFEKPSPSGELESYYRTGDLVSKDSDGQLYFLGRKDRQVKIRGYRVELDEVETVFGSLAEVKIAVSVVTRERNASRELIVFLSPQSGVSLDTRTLMKRAKTRLPRYALPHQIHIREDFPKTTSGKIDRMRLAAELESDNSNLALSH